MVKKGSAGWSKADKHLLVHVIVQAEQDRRRLREERAKMIKKWDEGDPVMEELADQLRQLAAMKTDLQYEMEH